jgi:hypothetical protein
LSCASRPRPQSHPLTKTAPSHLTNIIHPLARPDAMAGTYGTFSTSGSSSTAPRGFRDTQEDAKSAHSSERTATIHDQTLLARVDSRTEEDAVIVQKIGVTRIEALYRVLGSSKGEAHIWHFYVSIGLISYAYSLSSNTVSNFSSFATSSFGKHSGYGRGRRLCSRRRWCVRLFNALSVFGSLRHQTNAWLFGLAAKPFIAKLSDTTSRPIAYLFSLIFYVLGFIVVASAQNVNALAAGVFDLRPMGQPYRSMLNLTIGELLYTIGNTGIDLITHILVADISPLEWRGFMTALPASPYIVNTFIS